MAARKRRSAQEEAFDLINDLYDGVDVDHLTAEDILCISNNKKSLEIIKWLLALREDFKQFNSSLKFIAYARNPSFTQWIVQLGDFLNGFEVRHISNYFNRGSVYEITYLRDPVVYNTVVSNLQEASDFSIKCLTGRITETRG